MKNYKEFIKSSIVPARDERIKGLSDDVYNYAHYFFTDGAIAAYFVLLGDPQSDKGWFESIMDIMSREVMEASFSPAPMHPMLAEYWLEGAKEAWRVLKSE